MRSIETIRLLIHPANTISYRQMAGRPPQKGRTSPGCCSKGSSVAQSARITAATDLSRGRTKELLSVLWIVGSSQRVDIGFYLGDSILGPTVSTMDSRVIIGFYIGTLF